jgi:hypothetical protein
MIQNRKKGENLSILNEFPNSKRGSAKSQA